MHLLPGGGRSGWPWDVAVAPHERIAPLGELVTERAVMSRHLHPREGRNHGKGQAALSLSLRHLRPIRPPQEGPAEPQDHGR
jgi:hypothetical protein